MRAFGAFVLAGLAVVLALLSAPLLALAGMCTYASARLLGAPDEPDEPVVVRAPPRCATVINDVRTSTVSQ